MQTAQTTQTDDLTKVIPQTTSRTYNGITIQIAPFKIGKLQRVLSAVQPISHMLMNRQPDQQIDTGSLFLLYADDCLTLLEVLADQSREWVNELEQDEAFDLFSRLLEVNIDFFIRRVLPIMIDSLKRMVASVRNDPKLKEILGQMASNALSKMATTTTTS